VSLHLGKKLLVKPVYDQFKQLSNAVAIRKAVLGHVVENIEPISINRWLQGSQPAPARHPDAALEICRWVSKGNRFQTEPLIMRSWQDVSEMKIHWKFAMRPVFASLEKNI